ncbi:hypothetical protein Nepgr_009533 [Nepenthes gracilis]|uniref:Pentatricopeptide repeat-containing protein n=1 Tax=Nepenthes gracilis TaxID=150966 RepID=A0AAD3XK81_NEPGR|nr:hypothetical protein Nepgr_009533 [Nepenthes gracilis]
MARSIVRTRAISSFFCRSPATTLRFSSLSDINSAAAAATEFVAPTEFSTRLLLPTLQPFNDAELISKILLEQHNPFHAMESSLQLYGISLSSHLFHQTLLRLKNNSKIALSFFSWAWAQSQTQAQAHFSPDVTSFDLMIDILGKVRQFDVAWQLIVQMQTLNLKPQSSTFLILIRRLIAAGFTRQAIRAFDDMPCFVEADACEDDFIFLLDTLCKYGYIKVSMEVFNRRKYDFNVGSKVYTVLIFGWCKVNRVDMGERLLREMVEKGIEPNVVTYNVLLNGICRRASLHPDDRLERTIRAADNVLNEMRDRGIEPDVTSYSIVLHVYSRAHKPELTLDKLEMMKEKGICPSVATYTSAIKCLSSCGRLEDAERLLDEMVGYGVSPSAVTYNCFFKEYRGRKDAERAISLYRNMKKAGSCMPSMHTYNIMVGMFMKLNKMGIVKEIWDDMKGSGAGPDLDSYTLLIHGLIEKQKWRAACEYFVEMIERGFLPQKITFETLYRGLIQADKLRTWRRLKKKLEEESMSFGSEFVHYRLLPYRR